PHHPPYRRCHRRLCLHGRRSGTRAGHGLHRLSGAANDSEICRGRLPRIPRSPHRDVGTAQAGQGERPRPDDLLGAAMFQWVNVKGWVMVIGTITAYAAIAAFPLNIVFQVVLSLILGALCCTAWALFGTALRPILTSPKAVRAFNIVMALLL